MRKTLPISLALAALIGFTGCSQSSDTATGDNAAVSSEETTILRFAHFWPATSSTHKDIFDYWAKKVEEESKGRIKVEIYPSATLSKPDATYDNVAKGVVDIGSTLQGYTTGRFPLTQIAELPGLSNSATQMNCMLQTLYDDGVISSEYEDTHLLFMMGTGPGGLHTVDKPIRKPEDLKGMRIRGPSAITGNIIEAAGGTPVGLPVTDLYTSLQRGVLDGISLPWDAMGSFKLTELTNTHTNIPFYSSPIVVTMNKDKYASLPDDLKKVIDDNSGKAMAAVAGKVFDAQDAKFIAEAKAKGDTMIDIPNPLSDPDWKAPLEAGTQKYLKDTEALGLDAQTVYQKAQEASAACKS
ncbi:TRAP transporter substrate-binding protein [Psychrobacter sp. LV10R520-6]|uniref:TRAP transporter substrate-binding protein n=1 Tax=Psychrobacter sp. LV10R520-6 TaxID=1415574 RepID=UPI0024CAEF2A|nr:TRAP transporter substrate-binding protein [Psychrobacter sp. LV10R520-6]SNT70457.1 TRAP-type C4-dicarboxylate transport system, substrate-binding protein [Psychrobacter sp. LV10R520-6]